jgi:hypothetical protein
MDWKAPLSAIVGYSWEVRLHDVEPVYFLAVWVTTVNLIPFIISGFSASFYKEPKYTIAASLALYSLVAKGITNIKHRYTKLAVIGIIVERQQAFRQIISQGSQSRRRACC